ncbi:MAG: HlyD family efflux transporter periplasmic adaptor subunit [Granulosicoccus sp.]
MSRSCSVTQLAGDKLLTYRQAALLTLSSELLDAPSLELGLTELVNALHHQLRCDRVVLALVSGNDLKLAAISQQAVVDEASNEVRQLLAAMLEACDREAAVSWPVPDALTPGIVEAHRRLASGRPDLQLRSIPLYHDETLVGALLVELNDCDAWSPLTLELLDQAAALSAPLIHLRVRAARSLRSYLRARVSSVLEGLFGPRYLVLKMAVAMTVLLLVVASLVSVDRQVVAKAEVMSIDQRVVTAPLSGYISTALVRAGDVVAEGDVMLTLDTRDLQLQATRYNNEINSAQSEFRAAMASHDRKAMAIAQATLAKSRAERDLVSRQLERAVLRAPTNGIVVSDALAQAVGAPVTRGEILLELAPTEAHEVHLLIDEADINDVSFGQTGLLALMADPGTRLGFHVSTVRPVAEAAGGASRFRVTAALSQSSVDLRPGQTGIARLTTGETSILDASTHRFSRWLSQQWWRWFG